MKRKKFSWLFFELERNRSHEKGAQSSFEFAWSSSSWNWLALDGFSIKWYMSDRFQLSMRTSWIASIKVGLYRRGHYHVRCAWRFDFVWVTVIRATASSVKFSNLIELEKLDLFCERSYHFWLGTLFIWTDRLIVCFDKLSKTGRVCTVLFPRT